MCVPCNMNLSLIWLLRNWSNNVFNFNKYELSFEVQWTEEQSAAVSCSSSDVNMLQVFLYPYGETDQHEEVEKFWSWAWVCTNTQMLNAHLTWKNNEIIS